MGRKKKVILDVTPEVVYQDEDITVTKDRELTTEELDEIYKNVGERLDSQEAQVSIEEVVPDTMPKRKGLLKVKCKCGNISSMSEQIIEDGLVWSMIIGNDHYMTLACPDCGANLTMYIDEIINDELPKESN
jgi:predicted nucleic-acid-binding Zn-ribbon protein